MTALSKTDLFGPAGTPRVAIVGARVRRDRGRRQAQAGRDPQLHDLREVGAGRRHVVGQPVPRRRGRRRVARVLVPVQARSTGRGPTPSRPSCRRYLEETVTDWGLWSHLRLGVAVDRAEWDETRTSTRSPSTPARRSSATSSWPPPDSSTCRSTPRGRGSMTSRGRSSTRRGGSTSTTSPARPSRWWAPDPRPRRSSPRSCRSWTTGCICSSASRVGSARRATVTTRPRAGAACATRSTTGGHGSRSSTDSRKACGAAAIYRPGTPDQPDP